MYLTHPLLTMLKYSWRRVIVEGLVLGWKGRIEGGEGDSGRRGRDVRRESRKKRA